MNRIKSKVALLLASVAAMFAVPAQAAVPAGVETVFTTAATDFGTVVGYGWVLFLVIVGGLMLFGIVRKVIARSAGR
jgi:hypothetical protein